MRNGLIAALLASAALTLPPAAWAEPPAGSADAPAGAPGGYTVADADQAATLLADRIVTTADNRLLAEGAVEIYWKQNLLTAHRVIYDQTTETLTIEGPIRLVEPGQTGSVIVADQAELSRDLQNGVMLGARMVMARELQLAANRIDRKDGRITTLTEVVASSCRICASDPTPLWEIRARKITHDNDTRQLHFEGAQFRVMGVPLVWLPKLRMPDPTVTRMSGLLRPSFRTTSSLGAGLKLPYFIALGPSADLTVTPYLSSSYTRTLGLRYRQAFDNGTINAEGALSSDSIRKGENRGYLFADGTFKLPSDYTLGLQLKVVSDPSYLLNYGITEDDRLWSGVTLEKVHRNEMIWLRAGNTHSIRSGESNSTEPMLSGDFSWTRVIRPAVIGGEATIDWSVHAHRRASDMTVDGIEDSDTVSDGRDTLRTSFVAGWRRQWLLSGGVLAAMQTELAGDAVMVRQDENWADHTLRALPTVGVELRWPWVATSGRAAQVIEPIAQLVWSPDNLKQVANEDSLLTEFDEGNLFSFSRYPGGDAREEGLRANLGLSWTRHDASGWSLGVTAGRVVRLTDTDQFPTGSGLSGRRSDWLIAAHLTTAEGLTLSNRALFDNDFGFSRDELRLAFAGDKYQIAAGYLWMDASETEGRITDTSELLLETGWTWTEGWRSTLSTRYDFTAERAARATVGLEYANECMSVDLSLSRRFTSSSTVKPETDFGLSVQLAGFGATSTSRKTTGGSATRVCRY